MAITRTRFRRTTEFARPSISVPKFAKSGHLITYAIGDRIIADDR